MAGNPTPAWKQEGILIARSMGMTRQEIAARIGVSSATIQRVILDARAAGDPRADERNAGWAQGEDQDAIWARIEPILAGLRGGAVRLPGDDGAEDDEEECEGAGGWVRPSAPKEPPPPLCRVALSLVSKGVPEAEARAAASRYRATTEQREAAMRRRARQGVAP